MKRAQSQGSIAATRYNSSARSGGGILSVCRPKHIPDGADIRRTGACGRASFRTISDSLSRSLYLAEGAWVRCSGRCLRRPRKNYQCYLPHPHPQANHQRKNAPRLTPAESAADKAITDYIKKVSDLAKVIDAAEKSYRQARDAATAPLLQGNLNSLQSYIKNDDVLEAGSCIDDLELERFGAQVIDRKECRQGFCGTRGCDQKISRRRSGS